MGLNEIGCDGVHWIQVCLLVGSCQYGNEPLSCIKGGEYLD
jgi:hypothetical protein